MKKLLALLLSLLMAGSMLSPGLPAFAQAAAETSTEAEQEDTGTEIQAAGEQNADSEGSAAGEDYAEGAGKLDISQGTVPFIDENDPLMDNLAVYMVELTTDTLIHARNANERRYPASLTKIMTAILTLENIPDLDREITFTAELQDYVYQINISLGGGISLGGITLNETLTAEQLLYAIMLPSANEAAIMLAYEIGDGSLERFAEMMNEKAKEIGCLDTHFVNSNGLFDENHYTTAYDMYLITKYALQYDLFREIVATPSYDTGPTNQQENLHWDNTNQMIVQGSGFYHPEITGVKTGTLEESGRCLITTAQKDGYEYLLVLMGAPYMDEAGNYISPNQAFVLTSEFYDWVFDTYKAKTIVEKGDKVSSINNVRLAKDGKDFLQLVSAETFSALIPNNIDVSNVRRIAYNNNGERIGENDYVTAPVEKGAKMGTLKLILYGSVLGEVDLIAAEDIEVSPLLLTLDEIGQFFQNFWFRFVFLFVVLIIVFSIIVNAVKRRKRRRYRRVTRRRRF